MRRALIIANGDYDDRTIPDLPAPVKDAGELAGLLADRDVGSFEVDVVNNGTLREVQIALSALVASADEDDLILIHFSGHGSSDPQTGGLFYYVKDSDSRHLMATSLSGSFIRRSLDGLSSRTPAVVFIDCCYSGSMSADLIAKSVTQAATPDYLAASGRAIFMSSSARQRSFEVEVEVEVEVEDDEIGFTSAFTRVILDGIRTGEADLDQDGWVTLDELSTYTMERLRNLSAGQTPLLSEIGVDGRIHISQVPSGSRRPVGDLPEELIAACRSDFTAIRLAGVAALDDFQVSAVRGRSAAARRLLREMAKDPVGRVSLAAKQALNKDKDKSAASSPRPLRSNSRRATPVAATIVDVEQLMRSAAGCAEVASSDDSRPMLRGVLLEAQEKSLRMTATDSYRLYSTEIEADGEAFTALIDARFLRNMRLPPRERSAKLIQCRNVLEVEAGKAVFSATHLAGSFPNYSGLVREMGPDMVAGFTSSELAASLDDLTSRSAPHDPVVLSIGEKEISLSVASSPVDERFSAVPNLGQGTVEELRVAFNPDFLRSALRTLDSVIVWMQVSDSKMPAILMPDGNDGEMYLLMPVMIG